MLIHWLWRVRDRAWRPWLSDSKMELLTLSRAKDNLGGLPL